jgi:hypothetical protein
MSPTRKLYVVRGRLFGEHSQPLFGDGRMEGAFPTRAEAEAFLEERECEWRRLGDVFPLSWLNGADELLTLTDFDEPVFRDWLEDAGIPPPPEERWEGQEDVYEKWLWDLSTAQCERLYEALHHFRSREVIEIDLVEGAYLPGDWEEWEARAQRWLLHPQERPQPPREPPGVPLGEEDIPF